VRILPKVVVQVKKAMLGGALIFQTLLQGNEPGSPNYKDL